MNSTTKYLEAFSRVADALVEEKESVLAALNSVETLRTAVSEFEKTVRALRSYRDELPMLAGRGPVGRVVVYLPFNTPLYSLVLYSFGPLLAGNSVLVRPSRLTRDVVETIWRLVGGACRDLPLAITREGGRELLHRIVVDKEVDALVFTGSWQNVESLIESIPREIKIIYSGSGVNPFIVYADADVSASVDVAVASRIFNSGQDCLAAERFYVAEQIFDIFSARLVACVKNLRVGPLTDPSVDVGPVLSDEIVSSVERLLAAAPDGRTVLYESPIVGRLVPPIVIATVDDDPIVRSEKYAPVFPLVSFASDDELQRCLIRSEFCLGATIYGTSPRDLSRLFPHVATNCSLLAIEEADAHVPFGGHRKSGFVLHDGKRTSGPLLFSVETSVSDR